MAARPTSYVIGCVVSALAASSVGCRRSSDMFIKRVWGDETVIITVTDAELAPISPTSRLVLPKEQASFELNIPDEVIVFAQTYTDLPPDRDLSRCTIRAGVTEGNSLGEPKDTWRSGVISASTDTVELRLDSESTQDFSLRLHGCMEPGPSCELTVGPVSTSLTLQASLQRTAVIRDDLVFAAGGPRSTQDPAMLLMRIEGDSASLLPSDDRIQGDSAGIFPGPPVIGASKRGDLFWIDIDGNLLDVERLSVAPWLIDVGVDGTAIIVTREGEFFELVAGSTLTRSLPPPVPVGSVPQPTDPKLDVVRRDRIVTVGIDGNIYLFDGTAWRLSLNQDGAETRVVVADERYIIVLGDFTRTIMFDETIGRWQDLSAPILGGLVRAGSRVGDGRFVVVGQGGRASFFNGQQWCRIPTVIPRSLDDVAASPTGTVAYGVGAISGPGTEPAIIRVDLPPP